MLNKQAFLNIKSQVKKIEVPEWNDHVYVKKFSAAERVKFLQTINGEEAPTTEVFIARMVRLLQICLSDENGCRIFDDSEEDFEILNAKDVKILERIFDEAMKFNGIGVEEEKAAIKN
jgi:predicted metal-dependent phosphoesterase TrpH